LAGLKQLAPVQLCVVYFLVRDGVVVYVGQTKSSWPRRVWQHARDREKHFDDVWYVECKDAATMMQMEARYIRELWPEYNRIGKRLTRVDRELLRHEITRGRGGEP
jgi:Uri superfamily endonuclease